MEKTIDFAELQELREQFNILSEKLEKQIIINETLIKESMKKKLSYVEKYYRWYFISYVLVAPAFAGILIYKNAHLGVIIFAMVLLLCEAMLYYWEYRKLNPKDFMAMRFVDAMEKVSQFKKRYNLVERVMLFPSIVLFVLYVGLVSNYTFDVGTIIYYLICIIIIYIGMFNSKKKMFSRLDAVLKQIKELRSE